MLNLKDLIEVEKKLLKDIKNKKPNYSDNS